VSSGAVALAREAEVPAGDGWLSPAERATLAGLRFPARRRDWRLGRWAARRALAAVLGPVPVEVRAAADGAPEALADGRPAPVTISISHRAGVGACLVADAGRPAGCDLELVEPHSAALARDFFTPAELALVEQAGPDARDLTVALVWSAKESALKALRQGLRLDTREVEVGLAGPPGTGLPSGWRRLWVRHGERSLGGWWRLEGDHVLTVVTEPAATPPPALLDRPRTGIS
jgi:4'-phosphopantetheinyl transferase